MRTYCVGTNHSAYGNCSNVELNSLTERRMARIKYGDKWLYAGMHVLALEYFHGTTVYTELFTMLMLLGIVGLQLAFLKVIEKD